MIDMLAFIWTGFYNTFWKKLGILLIKHNGFTCKRFHFWELGILFVNTTEEVDAKDCKIFDDLGGIFLGISWDEAFEVIIVDVHFHSVILLVYLTIRKYAVKNSIFVTTLKFNLIQRFT